MNTRRQFLATTSLGLTALPSLRALPPPRRACIIGHTGRGNFGHGLDQVFKGLPGIVTAGIADGNPEGLEKARQRSGAQRGYADYREMLEKEKPHFVSVAPRWTDQHHAMAMAALEAGAHVYIEKPFMQSLAEADEVLALAVKKNLKIACAHQMHLDPHILHLEDQLLEDKPIGALKEIRMFGKMDARAGGEDLLVLGTHLCDLSMQFGGTPQWCEARVLQDGKPATLQDRKPSIRENLGPLLGNEIHAKFETCCGVALTFLSRKEEREKTGGWGMELVGTSSKLRIFANHPPTLKFEGASWPVVEPYHAPEDGLKGMAAANRRVVKDWLRAIDEDREPLGSGTRAMKALEMIHAVFHAGLSGKRVRLPLPDRRHPLEAG